MGVRAFVMAMQVVRSCSGAAAVEFVLIAPIFLFLMVGAVDFGRAIYTKFSIESAVSAGSNYALVNAESVSSANAGDLSVKIAALLAGNSSVSDVKAKVTINNGPVATLDGGVITKSGAGAGADSCYCPTKYGGSLAWGSAVSCGSTCGGSGGRAGKFVDIRAERPYTPFFRIFDIGLGNRMSARALVQTK